MSQGRFALGVGVVAVSVAVFAGGCGVGGDVSALTDVLGSVDADTTLAELLNEITVGDLVAAFQAFVSDAQGRFGGGCAAATLTDEQIVEIEALQAQLDAEEITQDAFVDGVHEIIGDMGAGIPFAGFRFYGGPFGHRMGARDAAPLDLTEEQQSLAEDIFRSGHEDIDALRQEAKGEIRALLTEEQLAILDEMQLAYQGGYAPPPRFHGPLAPPPFQHDGRPASQRFDEALDLTPEQEAEVETIREELRAAVSARHDQAQDEFLAILTEEQLQALEEIRPQEE